MISPSTAQELRAAALAQTTAHDCLDPTSWIDLDIAGKCRVVAICSGPGIGEQLASWAHLVAYTMGDGTPIADAVAIIDRSLAPGRRTRIGTDEDHIWIEPIGKRDYWLRRNEAGEQSLDIE